MMRRRPDRVAETRDGKQRDTHTLKDGSERRKKKGERRDGRILQCVLREIEELRLLLVRRRGKVRQQEPDEKEKKEEGERLSRFDDS